MKSSAIILRTPKWGNLRCISHSCRNSVILHTWLHCALDRGAQLPLKPTALHFPSLCVIGQSLNGYKSTNSIKVSDKLDWFTPTEYLVWCLSCLAVIAWLTYNGSWKPLAFVPLASGHTAIMGSHRPSANTGNGATCLLGRETDVICGPGLFAQTQQKVLFTHASGRDRAKVL